MDQQKSEMQYAPIAMFVYNRVDHAQKTIEALKKNRGIEKTQLFLFCDAAKNEKATDAVKAVHAFARSLGNDSAFAQVHLTFAQKNKGLANSIIAGVSQVIALTGAVIVLEDDLVTSTDFLEYMNAALSYFQQDQRIWSISGYGPPIKLPKGPQRETYLTGRGCSWGWATWQDRWEKVDWQVSRYEEFIKDPWMRRRFNATGTDMTPMLRAQREGRNDSWAIRWCFEQFLRKMYTVYPVESRLQNIGIDGSGTHGALGDKYDVDLEPDHPLPDFRDLQFDPVIQARFARIYGRTPQDYFRKAKQILGITPKKQS